MANKGSRNIFFTACAGMLLFGIALITLGSVANDLRLKLGLNDLSAGTLFSILPFGVLAGSLVFGPVADRYGYRLLLATASFILFLGFEGLAFTRSADLIKLYVFTIGFSGGVINGATNAVVADISDQGKTGKLSLLGVFFGIGALGMPLVLGLLRDIADFEIIIALVGLLSLCASVAFAVTVFPAPKQKSGFPLAKGLSLLKEKSILLPGLFLFCQSSFEAIINNWTTLYLGEHIRLSPEKALFGLTFFVSGMTAMRLAVSMFFSRISGRRLLAISFAFILTALLVLISGTGLATSYSALFILGAGLASGFPVILGLTGEMYRELSGTAFSIVLTIALLGNMIVNYLMGILVSSHGIKHLVTVAFAELAVMIILTAIIFRNTKNQPINN